MKALDQPPSSANAPKAISSSGTRIGSISTTSGSWRTPSCSFAAVASDSLRASASSEESASPVR